MKSKRITANVPEYIKGVVARENNLQFAKSPGVVIPKDMKYPKMKYTHTSFYAFFKGCLA